MLIVSNITKSYGERFLFSDVSFTASAGDRFGIVGANGSGKTTLFDIIAGNIERDSGDVFIRKGVTLGYLYQNLAFNHEKSLLGEVMGAVSTAHKLEHRKMRIAEQLSETNDSGKQALLLKELADIETRFDSARGYSLEYEAKKILSGLGFGEPDYHRPTGEFSGGWLMRAGMAKLLLSDPDILFLDEPTNHLDLTALIWLEQYLRGYTGAVLIISHDRAFLNRIATRILALERGKAKLYHGDYDFYRTMREKEEETITATIKNQERFIEQQQRFIDRFRAKNTKATQVQSRIKRLEKMERAVSDRKDRSVRVRIHPSPRSGKMVVSLQNVSFGYDSTPFYRNLDLSLIRGDKTAFVGPNGAGKTTLLKLLAGELQPVDGVRSFGHNVRGVYYAQYQTEQLYPDNTVLAEMRRAAVTETDEQLRTALGAFLFSGDDVLKKVAVLSGGEQARLALAKLFLRPANLLLMDEPTNHLDIPSIDVLIDALTAYDGTLCIVTHDRDLIDRIVNKIVEVENGTVTEYLGNYTDYSEKKEREREPIPETPFQEQPELPGKKELDKERKRREGELRNRFYRESKHIRDSIEKIDSDMHGIEARIKEIEAILVDPSNCNDREIFNKTLGEYDTLKNRKSLLEDEWLELSEKMEAVRETVYGKEDE